MIKIFDISQAEAWDEVVKSFPNYDIYYLSGYLKAFYIHGDGKPQLLYYTADGIRAIYVYMQREIAEGVYDIITPYGYGGILFDGDVSEDKLLSFKTDYQQFLVEKGVVDNFVRYHPILNNAKNMRSLFTIIDLGETIAMDLSSEDIIWNNITSKNRNMIRKAEKNGVEILHSRDWGLFDDFMRIYNSTMNKDNAEDYYYFKDGFYCSIHNDLYDNYEMFYAVYKGEIIAMSIMIFANDRMHYHLSGSLSEYRNLAPSNLLLYKAALWGCHQGFDIFHLGGGIGSGEDSLFKFKAAFNRSSNFQFSIGKEIFNHEKYDELVNDRISKDPLFDCKSAFFPLYRS